LTPGKLTVQRPGVLAPIWKQCLNLVIPLEQFEKIAYAELSLDAATLGLVPVLSQVIFSFNEVVKKRNTFVGLYKGGQSPDFVPLYFGAPMAQGQDTTYPALIAGIGQYTDDGIWFSRRLVELLQKHGLELRKRGRKLPKVAKTNFENAEAAGLFRLTKVTVTGWLIRKLALALEHRTKNGLASAGSFSAGHLRVSPVVARRPGV
jgi:hypothetical protein